MQHVEHILVTVSTTPVGKLYAFWAVVSTFTRLRIMFCWCRPCMCQFVRMLLWTCWCWRCMSHASVCTPNSSYTWISTCMRMHVLLMSTLHASVCTTVTGTYWCRRYTSHASVCTPVCTFAFFADVDGSYISMQTYLCIQTYLLTYAFFTDASVACVCVSSVYTCIYRLCQHWHVYV